MNIADWPSWLGILLFGFTVTYFWRVAGVVLVRRLDPDGEALLLVRAIATALVAALVTKLVIQPSGVLAETSIVSRALALLVGIIGLRLMKRYQSVALMASLLALMVFETIRTSLL
jgi:branched-subunit amino acid transport protein